MAVTYTNYKDRNERRNYDALHKMLMILEDKDPTLRLSARSWLQDSKSDYSRIIDPLLKEFMTNNSMFRSYSGQLYYEDKYNADYIKENFTKLRNIILTTQEEFIKYVVLEPYSDYVKEHFQSVYEIVSGQQMEEDPANAIDADGGARPSDQNREVSHQIKPDKSQNKYIQVIIYVTLQFIMGQYVQSLGDDLYQETQIVNASASEFMELVIRSLTPYADLCTEVLHLIIRPLMSTLRTAIDNANAA